MGSDGCSVTVAKALMLDDTGPPGQLPNKIELDVLINGKSVSGKKQLFPIDLRSGYPVRFELSQFTFNRSTYPGSQLEALEFRRGDKLENLRFRCYDAQGNVADPLHDHWFVEIKKGGPLVPLDAVYKREVCRAKDRSESESENVPESCFGAVELRICDDATVPLRGDTVVQSISLVGQDKRSQELQFRVVRTRIPKYVEVQFLFFAG